MEMFGAAASDLDHTVAWMRDASSFLETAACLLEELKYADDMAKRVLSFVGVANQDVFGPRFRPVPILLDNEEAGGAAGLPNVLVDIESALYYRFGIVDERAFGEDAMRLPYARNAETAARDVSKAVNLLRDCGARVARISGDMAAWVQTCPVEAAFRSLPETTYPRRMSPHPLAIRWSAHLAKFLGEGAHFEDDALECSDRADLVNAADYLRTSNDTAALSDLVDAAATAQDLLVSVTRLQHELRRMVSVLREGVILMGGRDQLEAALAANAVVMSDEEE